LCYRNCEKAGLVNCGIAACSMSRDGCKSAVGKMTLEVLSAVGKALIFIASHK